jgi:hypothetical protein
VDGPHHDLIVDGDFCHSRAAACARLVLPSQWRQNLLACIPQHFLWRGPLRAPPSMQLVSNLSSAMEEYFQADFVFFNEVMLSHDDTTSKRRC